jgi:putative chitinase
VTLTQLSAFLPKLQSADVWLEALNTTFVEYEMNSVLRQACFLAQTAHESAEYTRLCENLNYSAKGLMATWPARFPELETAMLFERQPERIANYVYANRLGNGAIESGDGWRFRGRGILQITGRANYQSLGTKLSLNLLTSPELLEVPLNAARAAGEFWRTHSLNTLADRNTDDDFAEMTHRINGGQLGIVQRRSYLLRAITALT